MAFCFLFFFFLNLFITLKVGALTAAAFRVRLPINPRNKHWFILATKRALEPGLKDLTSLLCTYTLLSLLQGNLTLRWGMHTCLVSSSRPCWQARPPSPLFPLCRSLACGTPSWGCRFLAKKGWGRPRGSAEICASFMGGVRGEVIQPCCC